MKPIKTTEKMPTVPLSQLRKIVSRASDLDDDTEISLQFILTALFPTVWNNIQKYANDCYTNGYLAGLKDKEKNEN